MVLHLCASAGAPEKTKNPFTMEKKLKKMGKAICSWGGKVCHGTQVCRDKVCHGTLFYRGYRGKKGIHITRGMVCQASPPDIMMRSGDAQPICRSSDVMSRRDKILVEIAIVYNHKVP